MKVLVKATHKDAKIPVKLTTESDFCYDVYAVDDGVPATDKNGNVIPHTIKYDIGLAFEIVREDIPYEVTSNGDGSYDAKCFDMRKSPLILSIDGRPRSSVFTTGMVLSNCEGTIDESYRGSVSFIFYDLFPEMPKYKKGDRIGQIKIGFTIPIEFEVTDALSETERGEGAYGHSGR